MKQSQLNQGRLHYGMLLKLYFKNKVFGPGVSVLLRGVEEAGPLQGATRGMSAAYSGVWKMLKESEKAWGFPLTKRETSGKDGGDPVLTTQAVRLPEAYDSSMKEAREELDHLFEKHLPQDRVEKLKSS